MAKLIILLRVKDSIFYINDWLKRYEDIADGIVAVDNGSTDGTFEALSAHPKVIELIPTQGYDEGRDKSLLYAHARKHNPDWLLWIDVDEIFEPEMTRKHFDKLMSSKIIDRYAFRRFHFIDHKYFAASKFWLNYSAGHDRVLWREKPTGYFLNQIIDSPNVKGINGIKAYSSYRIKHLGYINKELVDRKAEIYRKIIPDSESALQTMYLEGEKRAEWIDRRNDIRVILLQIRLDMIQLKHFARKGMALISKAFSGLLKSITNRQSKLQQTTAN